jgi:hypothetical protein
MKIALVFIIINRKVFKRGDLSIKIFFKKKKISFQKQQFLHKH